MHLAFQFFLSIARNIEVKSLLGNSLNTASPLISHQSFQTAIMASVLLRLNIILMILLCSGSKTAHVRSLLFIDITLVGTVAIILRLIHFLRHEQSQAKARQVGHQHFLLSFHRYVNTAIAANDVSYIKLQYLLQVDGSQRHLAAYAAKTFFYFSLDAVHARLYTIEACLLPFKSDIAIVVGGCTPNVKAHGLHDAILILVYKVSPLAGDLVKGIAQALAYDGQFLLALLELKAAGLLLRQFDLLGTQGQLLAAQLVAGFGEQLFIALHIDNIKEAIALARHLVIQGYFYGLMGGSHYLGQQTTLQHLTVTLYLVVTGNTILHVSEIVVVGKTNTALSGIHQFCTNRAVGVLNFQQAQTGSAIRIYQTIHTEVAVVGELTKVAAVEELRLTGLGGTGVYTMVTPFPNKAAYEAVILHNQIPIFFGLSGAITHGMNIFAQNIGFNNSVLIKAGTCALIFAGKITLDLFSGVIHATKHIQHADIIFMIAGTIGRTLVVQQTGRIILLHPATGFFKVGTVTSFITQRPDHYRCAVLVANNIAFLTIQIGLFKHGVAGQLTVVVHPVAADQRNGTVRLQIRLRDHIKTVLAAQLREPRRIRIVAGTDRIDIVLLHQDQIHHSLFHANGITGERIAVVTVYTAEFNLLTVDQDHTVLNFDGAETDLLSNYFFFTFQNQGVLLGVFGIPFDYIFHFKGHITAFYILLTNDLAFRIHQGSLHRYAAAYIVNIYAQLTILIIVYQIHMGKEVTNVVLGTQHQIYITEDTAHT